MLLLDSSVCGLFKWRQFEPEVILLAVGWYLRFSLSYRDVEELLAERGLLADHVTVWRWVQRYAPALQRCLRRHLKPTNDSWRLAKRTEVRRVRSSGYCTASLLVCLELKPNSYNYRTQLRSISKLQHYHFLLREGQKRGP